MALALGFASGVSLGAQAAVTIYALKGPSGIGMIGLFEEPPRVAGLTLSAQALASADLMVARFLSGEAKAGILPPNIAAKLRAAGRPIVTAASVGNGMLSLVTSDKTIRTIRDLRGKEIYVAGQGATPDYVFRRLLAVNGIDAEKDVQLRFSMAYPEMAQSLIAGKISIAVLPEPFSTMARTGSETLAVPFDLQDEWAHAGGSAAYPMTLLVFDEGFARTHPAAVDAIRRSYRQSIEWVTANPGEAGVLVEKHDLGLKAGIAAAAIPRSGFAYVDSRQARPAIEALLSVFLAYAPGSIGGKLPDDGFYLK